MSLLDKMSTIFKADSRKLDVKSGKLYQNLLLNTLNYPLGNDDADKNINQGYMYNPDVYAIINKITSAAKTVKWQLLEVKDTNKHQELRYATKSEQISNPVQAIRTKQEAYEVVSDPSVQLYRLLKRPNPMQGFGEWIENVLGFKLAIGESFVNGTFIRNGVNAGLINEMWTMPPQLIDLETSSSKIVSAYLLRNIMNSNGTVRFTPEEVMHIKYFNPDFRTPQSHLRGLSPLRAGARVVRFSNDAHTANASLMQNVGASGILSVNPEHITEEQAKSVQDRYEDQYSGVYNRGKIIVAGGEMNWQQIGLSPVDLEIIESQKMTFRKLCDVYGVDSSLFNDPDASAHSTKQEARKALYMEKVFPELDTLRDELNRWVVSRYNEVMGTKYYLDYDINSVPAIQDEMKKTVERFWNAWWLSGNERRVAMGYDWEEAMDRYFIPTGMMPMSREQLIEGLGIFDDRGNGNAVTGQEAEQLSNTEQE